MKRAGFFAGMTVALLTVLGTQPGRAMTVAPSPLAADAAALATEVQGNQQQFRRNNNQNANRGNSNNRQNANRTNNNNRQNANRNNNNRQNANRNNNNRNNANRNRQNANNWNNRNNRNNWNNNRNRHRPVRHWGWRPHFGTVIGGVALGTIIAANTIPVAPASNLCWFWTDPSMTRGYWDFCW
jgi:hypothetical protein